MGWLPLRSLFFVSLSAKQLWFFKGVRLCLLMLKCKFTKNLAYLGV